jgi:predicted alpha/beta superfamily hydrolase
MKTASYSKDTIIKIIDEDYLIPQLNKRRRVAALLPHDYYTSAKYYPVLYLHDGQNLFDNHAPFGTWGVDKCMATLSDLGLDMVVIAIDHGGKDRIAEYLPYDNNTYTDKKGEQYTKFMMEELKPYVDTHFRVHEGREHTAIGGSSMGGLISLYAGINHNDVFGNMLIFSPSLWISSQVFHHALAFKPKAPSRCYLYCGGQESDSLKPSMDMMHDILKSKHPHLDVSFSYNPEGKHQEYYWGLAFNHAIQWLFTNQIKSHHD